jgi:S-DNA-T family DNA segregation ATPase FtsK/SpoIIIE
LHLPFLLGDDVRLDLAALPHLLVAGSTGSGKSVFLNSLLLDLIESGGADTKMMLFDPKRVEFAPYKPWTGSIYTDEYDTALALEWAVSYMDERFELLERHRVRDIAAYNAIREMDDQMHRLVIVVDELANLVLGQEGRRIALALTRLAQMARAVGIHLVLATQRPTVDVVTGLLKANIPARVAFAVVTQTDSRVILDEPGAEELLGKGQMLARIAVQRGLVRLQVRYTSIEDVDRVIKHHLEVRR